MPFKGIVSWVTNAFSVIPLPSFNGIAGTLEILNITNTAIRQVPNAIKNLQALKKLYLGSNHITASNVGNDVFDGIISTLELLSFDNCYLTHVPPAVVRLRTLRMLNLTANHLHVLDQYQFSKMAALRYLVLNENLISVIKHLAFSGLGNLTKLWLSRCALQYVPSGALGQPPNLELVDLSYNRITQLVDDSFPNMNSLKDLSLSGNPLTNISKLAFRGLATMDRLHMDDCGLGRVPKAIQYAYGLHNVDLYNNNITCDCSLKWIANWRASVGLIPHIQSVCHGPNDDLDMYIRYDLKHCP
ncbi:leucine-rich repeat and immunoglobulin-like domain-containing nogo receptor-interacting protein 1 [Gigantopelta aegis]|uniref:leucine-rich repeat and immunoglobulin-like domain-containing nogo receptor-interacting protein 1 n=1 Tax=Gigantopelta aegis TaxID=1735272 RepID=UPI001B888757|nr:leucine-rich repeat and immunoglobulin-like domain-containing nogo receptor-interacting protein 1 [Gigantopelta aegis]